MFPCLSETLSLSRTGREVLLVRVEVGIRKGLPMFQILGLASQNTKESRDRLRLALEASGFFFPLDTIIVNLDPNHRPKKVSFFDLAIAVGLLLASGQWQNPFAERLIAIGSLSLSGQVQASGELLELLWAYPKEEDMIFLVPEELKQMRLPNAKFVFLSSLFDITQLKNTVEKKSFSFPPSIESSKKWDQEFLTASQMKAFSGLCYSVLGRHHCLLIGNPGTGKTKLTKLVSQIQPDWQLADFENKEVIPFTTQLTRNGEWKPRPFRKPHHTTTEQALVGGGNSLTLGEVTLAHGGILFLDELTLFKEKAIESLREPMEEKKIEHARVFQRESFPADCTVIAALNPCPCGNYLGQKICHCSKKQIRDYLKKLSGPFLDRITIHVHLFTNSEFRNIPIRWFDFKAKLDKAFTFRQKREKEQNHLLEREMYDQLERMEIKLEFNKFSNRQKQNTMQLARTIADFNLSPTVEEQHLLEAYEFVQNSLFFEEIK